MTRREQRTVAVALAVLRAASKRFGESVQDEPVRLALRVLLPHVDHHALSAFWRVAANPNPSQRVHLLKRMLSVIEAVVARRGGGQGRSGL